MRPKHVRRAIVAFAPMHIERVHFCAGRVMRRDVERVKVIPISIDARPFCHREPHFGKDCRDLFGHLADRVDRALAHRAGGQGDIQPFALQSFVQCGIGQRGLFGGQRAVDFVLERIESRPCDLALFWGHFPQFAHLEADLSLFADGLNAQVLQAGFISRAGNEFDVLLAQIVHVGLRNVRHLLHWLKAGLNPRRAQMSVQGPFARRAVALEP